MSVRPPGRLLRLVFKAPVVLYRLRLGWLLGSRFILLTHTGRKTGHTRMIVIEVVAHDRSIPQVVVIAAWGEHAQWVRNIEAAPAVSVQFGRARWSHPEHRFLEPAQAAETIAAYRSKHPFAAGVLARLLGWPRDTDDPAYERFVQTLCAVAFRPATANPPGDTRHPGHDQVFPGQCGIVATGVLQHDQPARMFIPDAGLSRKERGH